MPALGKKLEPIAVAAGLLSLLSLPSAPGAEASLPNGRPQTNSNK